MAVELETFVAGKGINCNKLNSNFAALQNLANANESDLQKIANTALLKDGSNLTPEVINDFKKDLPIVLSGQSGDVSLTDNSAYFISLSGNAEIVLPNVPQDQYSHTITVVVMQSEYSLNVDKSGTAEILGSNTELDNTKPFSILYVYNKIDSKWYYYITQ